MWHTKLFKTKTQMERFTARYDSRIEWQQKITDKGYCIEYRYLKFRPYPLKRKDTVAEYERLEAIKRQY